MDVFILIFTGFTEPDPISWFNEGCKGGQLLVLMWSLFAFFITAAYSSMLLSFLTLPNFEKVVQTPEDILALQKSVIMFPVDEDGVDLETLQATFSDDVALWANNHKEIIFSQTEEEITNAVIKEGKILINSKRAVLEDEAFAGYLDQVRFSTDPLINGNNDVLFIGRNFPWTDLIIDDMLRMSAGGIFDHYFFSGINPDRLQILEPRNYPQSSYNNNPIKFEQMLFTFIFWIGGMIVATFTFFAERVRGVQN